MMRKPWATTGCFNEAQPWGWEGTPPSRWRRETRTAGFNEAQPWGWEGTPRAKAYQEFIAMLQ